MGRLITISTYVDVDVEWDDVDTADLLDELGKRLGSVIKSEWDSENHKQFVGMMQLYNREDNLLNQMKEEVWSELRDKFTLSELQQLLSR